MAVFPTFRGPGALLCGAALMTLGACANSGFDFDLRDNLGNAFDTSDAALAVRTEARPRPDSRGVISYPNYQVVVARRGDTVNTIAARVGLSADELARYNGMPQDLPLRRGEIVALPRRVAEPSPATGARTSGPILPAPAPVVGTPIANDTISSAPLDSSVIQPAAPRPTTGPEGQEPIRHKVKRGETAYSVARQYGIPVKALAEWNGLSGDLAIREGQFLLIPVALSMPAPPPQSPPGSGSLAPVPPSAAQPLPDEKATAEKPKETPPSPALAAEKTKASDTARFVLPVNGPIIRTFKKGKNDGIDISASAGSPVRAADAGTVAAITRDTDQIPILVLRHADNILTVYAGVESISVQKGQTVKRGQEIAKVRGGAAPGLHFEVREGFDSVDPVPYVN
ncbi:LysM peptidoglycan-binding domain-containing protein [Oceaniglobus trochenteri]|uniref:LysM peptidoglycan-binding domain-containing protein n=1 Tax=Oceaniglobus trochenteri TaxID=2763260 RepID=UPI001CFF80C3|nr:LysM peptidoglycan-binding domain-containing protein [Oceaniglobus trochenteri]